MEETYRTNCHCSSPSHCSYSPHGSFFLGLPPFPLQAFLLLQLSQREPAKIRMPTFLSPNFFARG